MTSPISRSSLSCVDVSLVSFDIKLQRRSVAHLWTQMTSVCKDPGPEEAQREKNKMASVADHGLKRVVWKSKFTSVESAYR